ncbi:galactosyltransferase-related protein [Aestuariivirga sp.]|uniref:galactosyltransferase-related protein n=1 Tax=Aestuariivirga sp. TaxID=2650926 RepID=UPI00391C9762
MKNFTYDAQRYTKRLNVVVPYRNRAEHLAKFIPHMLMYFARDKLDSQIDFAINIIEQVSPQDFNRGKLKNVGFDLTRKDGDYVCFHDVDYLPIWADYSWSRIPARLIWHGLTLRENYESFFGGVVLFDNEVFQSVNGYPNCYWGWGPEDLELGMRCGQSGCGFEKRDGTYMALPHPHAGFEKPGVHSREARRSHTIFGERKNRLAELQATDGLSDLRYSVVEKMNAVRDGETLKNVVHYKVSIG